MSKCRCGPLHKRNRKKQGKGNPGNHKTSIKGHSWEGKGRERICSRCKMVPEHLYSTDY